MFFVYDIGMYLGGNTPISVADTRDGKIESYTYKYLEASGLKNDIVGLNNREGLPFHVVATSGKYLVQRVDTDFIKVNDIEFYLGDKTVFTSNVLAMSSIKSDGSSTVLYIGGRDTGLLRAIKEFIFAQAFDYSASGKVGCVHLDCGKFENHPDSLFMLYLRNCYLHYCGRDLVPFSVESFATQLLSNFDNIYCINLNNFVFFISRGVVIKVKRDILLRDYSKEMAEIVRQGLVYGNKFELGIAGELVCPRSGFINKLSFSDDFRYVFRYGRIGEVVYDCKRLNISAYSVLLSIDTLTIVKYNQGAKDLLRLVSSIQDKIVVTKDIFRDIYYNNEIMKELRNTMFYISDLDDSEVISFVRSFFDKGTWNLMKLGQLSSTHPARGLLQFFTSNLINAESKQLLY